MSNSRYFIMMRDRADAVKHVPSREESFFDEDFRMYVDKHGYHFTKDLAEYISKQMKNANGVYHTWTCDEVRDTMRTLDIPLPETSTIGDITYSANMAYADLFPIVVTDIPSCVLYARAIATDPDGYEGIQFYRWLADLMATDTHIDWERYL